MFLSFIKIKHFFIPIEKASAIYHLPVDAMGKAINPSEPRLRNMIVLSCTIHCVGLAIFFLFKDNKTGSL